MSNDDKWGKIRARWLKTPIGPDKVFVNSPGCQTQQEVHDYWDLNHRNKFKELRPSLEEGETVLFTRPRPYSEILMAEEQVVIQKNGLIRKSIRIGDRLILKTEKEIADLILANTSVPVPRIHEHYTSAEFEHIVRDYLPGQTVVDVWHGLTNSQKTQLTEQVMGCIRQFRSMESPVIKVDRICKREVVREDIKTCLDMNRVRLGCFFDVPEIAKYVKERCAVVEGQPIWFSHGALHCLNIIVHSDGQLSGIIDTKSCGFFPAYWEWITARQWTKISARTAWEHSLERRLASTKMVGWDGMWEVEMLIEACARYSSHSLRTDDREELKTESSAKIFEILGTSDIELPDPSTWLKTMHPGVVYYKDEIHKYPLVEQISTAWANNIPSERAGGEMPIRQ